MSQVPPTEITPELALQRAQMVNAALLGVQVVFALAVGVIVQVTGPLEPLVGKDPITAEPAPGAPAPAALPLFGAAAGALLIVAAWALAAAARARTVGSSEERVAQRFQNGSLLLAALLEGAVMLNLILVLLFGWSVWNAGVVIVGLLSAVAGFPTRAALDRWRTTARGTT